MNIPDELMEKMREAAIKDNMVARDTINEMINEAQKDTGFEAQMSLVVALLIRYMDDPMTLSIYLSNAVFMLAEDRNELAKSAN